MTSNTKANEREFQGKVISWILKHIDQGGLAFKSAVNDPSLYGLKRVRFPDVLLTLDVECRQPFCGWELKTPRTDIRDKNLLKDAVEKAQALHAKYFVTWNMQTAIIWRTPEGTRTTVNENDKVVDVGIDARITSVNDIRDPMKLLFLEDRCSQILRYLDSLYHDENINLIVLDTTIFVKLVSESGKAMFDPLLKDIRRENANRDFRQRLSAWAVKQGVNKYDQDYENTLSQQIAYRIIGKILFYITLRRNKPDLPKIQLPPDNHREAARKLLYLFQQALEVDYQAIFESDIPDEIKLSSETVKIIVDLTEKLSHWSFELMPLDVIGNVFEKLIPEEARHSLGQYFTPDNLVDLIVSFCIRDCDDIVMDPTCGTGTFLIRSYNRLKHLQRKEHHKLINQIWGIDIAGFPAELATINLFRQDFRDYLNFPRVLSKDFFNVMPGMKFEFPPPKKTIKTGERISVQIPKFDALMGNFPFIRQELIEKVEKGYKKKLEEVLLESWLKDYPQLFKNKTVSSKNRSVHELQLSGQADIYAYMFFHAAAHLKSGGRMGFITSNSWLDVAYGYELQKFFLSKFKLIGIFESRCEPWFEQSAVNTVFAILERSDDRKANEDNYVRFVKIKKPLKELFPQDSLIDAQARWNHLDSFVEKIAEIPDIFNAGIKDGFKKFEKIHSEYIRQPQIISYENEDVRVRIIKQSDLKNEVESSGQTVKWGQYLRAPDIYFEILEKCSDKFVPLAKVADIRRGITTGINEFFYLNEDKIKHWGIEPEFLKSVIKSPKESGGIKLQRKDLKYYVFLCHKDKSQLRGTNALKYIKWGEMQKTDDGKPWPEVESVTGRCNWYELPKRSPSLVLLPMISGSSLRCILNSIKAQVDHNLFEIVSEDNCLLNSLSIYLNSGIAFLERELIGRANLGDGALKIEGIDWDRILVPKKEILLKLKSNSSKAFDVLCQREINNIQSEAKMKDRLEFEKSVLKTLGLSPELYSQILNGVVDLVEERHLLPKLRSSKKKKRVEQDTDKLKEEIIEEIIPSGVIKFPEGFITGWPSVDCEEISVPLGKFNLGASGIMVWEICDENGNHVMEVSSRETAKFIVYSKNKDDCIVKVPEKNIIIKKAVQDYEIYLKELKKKLYVAFMEKSGDHNLSENLTHEVFNDFDLPYL